MKISIDVTGCQDCPYLRTGRTFGNDGRDGRTVFKCSKGVFGGKDDWGYSYGEYTVPKVAPYGCPFFKSNPIDRVASKLNVSIDKLEEILKDEHCEIISVDEVK